MFQAGISYQSTSIFFKLVWGKCAQKSIVLLLRLAPQKNNAPQASERTKKSPAWQEKQSVRHHKIWSWYYKKS